MPTDWIARDGFEFAHGRFRVQRGLVERVDAAALRSMFIPRLTPAANKVLRDHYRCDFVAGQLKHYGVAYDESELTGSGTKLLKKCLLEGKLDRVPDHIEALRSRLAEEWRDQLTLAEMAAIHPELIFEKYFLDASGRPDRQKTTDVLAVPVPPGSTYRRGLVLEEAGKVAGLRHDSRGDTLYFGWDGAAMGGAIAAHAAQEKREKKREQDARNAERRAMHTNYLQKPQNARGKGRGKGGGDWTPAGRYIVDCAGIENEWPIEGGGDLTLDVGATGTPGIFYAEFDFGVIEGVMVLGSQEAAVERYCEELDREARRGYDEEDDYSDDEEEEEEEDRGAAGSKRKAGRGRGRPPKKAKGAAAKPPLKWFLRWKGMETGEGEILYEVREGTVKFDDAKFARFKGTMDMVFVGGNVGFTARKVSDTPRGMSGVDGMWERFSEESHERARVGRWR